MRKCCFTEKSENNLWPPQELHIPGYYCDRSGKHALGVVMSWFSDWRYVYAENGEYLGDMQTMPYGGFNFYANKEDSLDQSIKRIYFEEGVKSVLTYMLTEFEYLEDLYLPSSVRYIGRV